MSDSILSEIEVNTLKNANIISNISSNNNDNPLIIKQRIKEYANAEMGRILVLDSAGRVRVDSAGLLDNMVLDNYEISQAFNMQETIGYYRTDKYILQVAVPIIKKVGHERKAEGVVFISKNVDEAFDTIQSFRNQLTILSAFAAILAVVVTIIVSGHITKPITLLSKTARKIGKGQFGEEVRIKSKDEIGRLAQDFNSMSKELYEIDKGRTQFIGDVSHELKSPLASIKALIDSLLYGEDNIEVYKEYLRDIDSEIDRLSDLVKSLLSLTKIEEKGIKKTDTPLEEIVQDAMKILKPLSDKYDVTVSLDMDGQPRVMCDREYIRMALINLIDNALKYRDVNKTDKKVELIGMNRRSGYELKIVDNGIGIKEEEIDSIFKKFYRSDLSRSRDTGGAGIGLSIVSRIMEVHGWKIIVDSKVGEGTTISIFIPQKSS
ncbi:MAG: sensor histidine kinase [Acetivibrionales bacterium]|nr:HAMP domain-containing histidine kinase [Clostridiaceae bacterium]